MTEARDPWPDTIYTHPVMYKGVPLMITSWRRIDGGHDVRHDFPHSSRTLLQEISSGSDSYALQGFITQRQGEPALAYEEIRKQLFVALKDRANPAVLVHPVEGDLEKMVARPGWTFSETTSEDGMGRFTVTFERSDVDIAPRAVADGATESGIAAALEETDEASGLTIAGITISPGFVGNVQAGMEKLGELQDAADWATGKMAMAKDKLDEWSAQLTDFGANVAAYVAAPQEMALATVGLYQSMRGIYAGVSGAARGTYEMYRSMFSFGDGDGDIEPTTAGLAERKNTQDTLNAEVQALALSYAYTAAAEIEYETVDEIDEVSATVEEQYQKLYANDTPSRDTLDKLAVLRWRIHAWLDAKRLTASRLVPVTARNTSARLLAFSYYGKADRGFEVATLNDIEDPAFIDGSVEIYTEWTASDSS